MDFKFDIRILAISILLHLSAFGLMSLYTSKHKVVKLDTIDVVINDSDKKTFLASKPKEKDPPLEETKNSKFFSEQPQRFTKETIAENLGNLKNQKTENSQKTESLKKTAESTTGPNFLPTSSQQPAQDERQSTVNFQVPNLAKGDFTFLNSDFSTYASFYNRITPKIIYNWGNNIDDIALFPHMREKLRQKLKWTTRIELVLDRTGHYKNAMIINSSGSPELDSAVVSALKNATPFLNPPTGMIEKDGTVHIAGEFTIYTQRPHLAY